jgi:hypothetical protein
MTLCANVRRTESSIFTYTAISVGVLSGTDRNQLQLDNAGVAQLICIQGGTIASAVGGTSTLNQWCHLCGVIESNSSRKVYLDGTEVGSNTTSISTQDAANSILIGARSNSGSIGNYFSGDIAEVGIWNVALTAAEIASLAKGMTCDKVRPQSLVFYAPLVRDLIDAKSGLALTNNNGATVANHPRVYA